MHAKNGIHWNKSNTGIIIYNTSIYQTVGGNAIKCLTFNLSQE